MLCMIPSVKTRTDSERRETLSEEKYGEELVIRDSDEGKNMDST